MVGHTGCVHTVVCSILNLLGPAPISDRWVLRRQSAHTPRTVALGTRYDFFHAHHIQKNIMERVRQAARVPHARGMRNRCSHRQG